jgi:acylpyruvate hydrolase
MRFVSAVHEGRELAGVLEGDEVVPLEGVTELGLQTPSSWLRDAPRQDTRIRLADLRLRPVIPRPGKVICIGLNYKAHIEETGRSDSDYPVFFTKFATSLTGPYDPIRLPPEPKEVDFEAEFAIVIGERARRVPRADVFSYVAGYAVANDVSMRDYQYKTSQWLQGKAWDAATPLGPALVTPDEVDISDVGIRLTLNGEVMQDSRTSLLIFDVPTLVSTISEFATLEPGDVILSGTPGGVGSRRDPPVLLKDGDQVVVEVEGVGRIENEVRAETA